MIALIADIIGILQIKSEPVIGVLGHLKVESADRYPAVGDGGLTGVEQATARSSVIIGVDAKPDPAIRIRGRVIEEYFEFGEGTCPGGIQESHGVQVTSALAGYGITFIESESNVGFGDGDRYRSDIGKGQAVEGLVGKRVGTGITVIGRIGEGTVGVKGQDAVADGT